MLQRARIYLLTVTCAAVLALACHDASPAPGIVGLPTAAVSPCGGPAGPGVPPTKPISIQLFLETLTPDQLVPVYRARFTWIDVATDEACYVITFRAGFAEPFTEQTVALPANTEEWVAPGQYSNPMQIDLAVASANASGRSESIAVHHETHYFD